MGGGRGGKGRGKVRAEGTKNEKNREHAGERETLFQSSKDLLKVST